MAEPKKTVKKTTKKKTPKASAALVATQPQDKDLALTAAKIAHERHCKDITVLDLTGISPATNFYVIATGTSDRQSRTVADEISAEAKKQGHQRFGIAGYDKGQWILLDFVTVVVHIFDEERRDYYNLEMLWGDGKKLAIDD